MIELTPGSNVFWYSGQQTHVNSKSLNATQMASAMLDIFFTRKVLSESNVKGGGGKVVR